MDGHTEHLELSVDEVESLSALRDAGHTCARLVARIPDDGWGLPTPCPGWDVSTLVVHVASIAENLVPFASGNELPAAIDPTELASPAHTAERIAVAVDRGVAGWSSRRLRTTREFPWGECQGISAVYFTLVEFVGHAWDLAAALGEVAGVDDHVACAAAEVLDRHVDVTQWPDLFGPPVLAREHVSPVGKLAARLGRDPDWNHVRASNVSVCGGTSCGTCSVITRSTPISSGSRVAARRFLSSHRSSTFWCS